MKKTVFWTCDQDEEVLTKESKDEAIEECLDGQDIMPDRIIVYGFSRKPIDKKKLTEFILEQTLDYINENYMGEDGHEPDGDAENACAYFVDKYVDKVAPWQCEESESEEIHVMDWIETNRPDWLVRE